MRGEMQYRRINKKTVFQPVEKPASLGFFDKNMGLDHPAEAGCRETDWGNESPNPLGFDIFAPAAHWRALLAQKAFRRW